MLWKINIFFARLIKNMSYPGKVYGIPSTRSSANVVVVSTAAPYSSSGSSGGASCYAASSAAAAAVAPTRIVVTPSFDAVSNAGSFSGAYGSAAKSSCTQCGSRYSYKSLDVPYTENLPGYGSDAAAYAVAFAPNYGVAAWGAVVPVSTVQAYGGTCGTANCSAFASLCYDV